MHPLFTKIGSFFKKLRPRGYVLLIAAILLPAVAIISAAMPTKDNSYVDGGTLSDTYDYVNLGSRYNLPLYTAQKAAYEEAGTPDSGVTGTVPVNSLTGTAIYADDATYGEAVSAYNTYAGHNEIRLLSAGHPVSFTHTPVATGLYYLAVDYQQITDDIDSLKISLTVNGQSPFYESQTLVLPSQWAFITDTFSLDRYGNEIQPRSQKVKQWQTQSIDDGKGMHRGLYGFMLHAGDTVALNYVNGNVLIGDIHYVLQDNLPTYEQYLALHGDAPVINTRLMYSARSLDTRSDPSIGLTTEQDPSAMYYKTDSLKLNIMNGESWHSGGQTIAYAIEAPSSGYYHLTFKYCQYALRDMPVFRKIMIDGAVPFADLDGYAFPYTTAFLNRTLVGENGDPLNIYFSAGLHILSFEAVNYPYREAVETIQYLMNRIQTLALEIKRYTSGGTDQYRDWDISLYFPNAESDIRSWADIIQALYVKLQKLSDISAPAEIGNLKTAVARMRDLADHINDLPSMMVQFSDGDSSVAQLLGSLMQTLLMPGLEFERFILHGDVSIPSPRANFFVKAYEGTARLVLSFFDTDYRATAAKKGELSVWVNHPRQYIEIMQQLIDREYDGDMKITLSQMPDENKLILANASGTSPDVAIGVDHWIPFEFASRGASVDLRTMPGYAESVSHFAKGAMIPLIFEDGVYGLPETQNFWVTYYRRDILSGIGVNDIPQTWDQIIALLPLLQSYGMNYFIPLSSYSGLKPFVATLPFIYQFGGDLYASDGMSTAINSEQTLEGITLMSNLFTLYNVQKYVASFFNNFRYGTMPIGIADLSTYLLLQTAAPELDGMWGMDLHPGADDGTGNIVRYSACGAQASMILEKSKYKDESWDFLRWWMSTDVQAEFAFELQSTYGNAYFWNSANLDAFAQASMPDEYKQIILNQWNYALEAPRIPGAYMVEREISNAWTDIVFNGTNPRQAIDEAVRVANREILYKMEEFGYVKDGVIIKNYVVPSIYNVDQWLTEV